MPPDEERDERKDDELIDEDEDLLGSLEGEGGEQEKEPEPPPPPPATWAAKQAQQPEENTAEYDVLAEEPEKSTAAEDQEEPEKPDEAEKPEKPEGPEAAEKPEETEEPEDTPSKAVEEGPEEGEEEPEAEPQPEPEPPPEAQPQLKPQPAPPVGAAALTPAEGGVPPGMADLPGRDPALDDDLHPPKAGLWPRFLAASLMIVLSMAAATSISLLLYATDIAKGLGGLPGVQSKLATVEGGGPQTILILGSDIRPEIEDVGRSDTTMLLRLDPDRDLIALLSLPRDLKVNIPGYGVNRLNQAYALGGPKLTLQTVKDLTGLRINHLVNVDFSGFAKAVNAVGCVYVDVDRDYFNTNVGVPFEAQYAEIDVDAGYQRLCGQDALDYVRYRHEDNDIVRAARQQDFLREARAKVPPGELWSERRSLIKIFTDYTTSDINDAGPLIEVMKLFIELRDANVRKVSFEADIGGPQSLYVTASDRQVQRAVRQFLGGGRGGRPASVPSRGKGGKGRKGGGGGGGEKPQLIDVSSQAETYGSQFAQERAFPVYAPKKLAPGSTYDDDSHVYGVDISKKEGFGSYKLVFQRTGPYGVSEYYGVMGTRWLDPPILDNPSDVRKIGGREYMLFYDGDRLRLVGWKTDLASYWLNNTLTQTLDAEEMLAIVKSMKEF